MGASESTFGFRLIQIAESSPAEKAGLTSYLDFIVAANGIFLSLNNTLNTIISKSLNCKVQLGVFNIISNDFRSVTVIPSNAWGGEGLLGASVRWENWKNCEGLRVLEVNPDSSAHKLGLQAKKDYILGTDTQSINDVGTFEVILAKGLKFDMFVLSANTGKVRRITIENCKSLGCTVGEGMMNSIKGVEIKEEEKKVEENVVVTVLQKKENELPPPPLLAIVKEKPKNIDIANVMPPPSIYEISLENLSFQPRVLLSKHIQIA